VNQLTDSDEVCQGYWDVRGCKNS